MKGTVYGRGDLASQVARTRTQLVLVSGDAYVGKTAVLELAAKQADELLVSPLEELDAGEGSLRSNFLQGLAQLIAQGNGEIPAIELFSKRLFEGAEKAGHALGKKVGLELGVELLTLLPGGASVGSAAVQAVGPAITGFRGDFAARVGEANSGVVADTLSLLAREVAQFVGKPIVVVLDSAERLSQDDERVLADLIRRLPKDARLWIGFATRDENERARCASFLNELGPKAAEVEVLPLAKADVAEWLEDSGLGKQDLEQAMRWSGGYPMLVGDVIAELRRGSSMNQLPLNKQFVATTKANMKRLGERAHGAARRLSVLPTRPPDVILRKIVGADANLWAQITAELQDARIFTQFIDEGPWFHEQRRKFILHDMRCDEARESRQAALDPLRSLFEEELYGFRIAKARSVVRLMSQLREELGDPQGEIGLLSGRLFRALGDYRRSLELLTAPRRDPRDWTDIEVEAAHNRAEILRLSGSYDQALDLWKRLEEYGTAQEDLVAQARATWGRSLTYKLIDAAREALDLCEHVDRLRAEARQGKGRVRRGVDPNTDGRRGHLTRHKAELYCYLGDYRAAAQECERGFSFYAGEKGSPSWWELTAVEAQLLRLEGKFELAIGRAEKAQSGFQEGAVGWRRGSVTVLRHLAQGGMAQDAEAAAPIWEQLLSADQDLYPHAPIYAHLGLAECARLGNQESEALDHLEKARSATKHLYEREGEELARRFGLGREWAYASLSQAAQALMRGDEAEAVECACEALSYAEARRVPWIRFWSLWLLAKSATGEREGRLDEASVALDAFQRRAGDLNVERQALTDIDELDLSSTAFNFP